MPKRLLTLLAESPIHAGAAAAEGALDLPIQREAVTGLPVIWGQSLKGALRDAARDQDWVSEVFGARPPGSGGDRTRGEDAARVEDIGGDLSPGQVAFGDAALLAFPAATDREPFAWTTSRQALHRLHRKATLLEADLGSLLTGLPGAHTTIGTAGWAGDKQTIGPYLDTVTVEETIAAIGTFIGMLCCPATDVFDYMRTKFGTDLLVVRDSDFRDLTRLATELAARVQLNEHKTVAHGPFYSEHLPVETVLVSLLSAEQDRHLRTVQEFFDGRAVQLGGDESIGKGMLWCRVHDTATLAAALPKES
ncbi:type III-B CRISPR module RAMP protein Cmr4 [Nocardia lijiangensis]|uniref:type III-B CRISPR module RAMP protein Cmr4 n=1 Tax=Nocardia lijiangensis TaxID=299618 RepID=UPI003D73B96A